MLRKPKTPKILFTGGGTAGHIFPIVAVTRDLTRLGFVADFFYIGPKDDFGAGIFSQEGIKVKAIMAGKIRRYFSWQGILQNIVDILFKMPLGFLQAFFYVFFLAPDLIFSKGGYGSLSAVLSGWIFQIPVFLHDSDVSPGLANRFMSKFTRTVFVSFPISQMEYFPAAKMISVGNPIRREMLTGSKEEAKKLFNLKGDKPVVLILGGSQGAQILNDMILNILPDILTDFELIHQTGEKYFADVKAESKVVMSKELGQYYHPFPFLKEIELKQAYRIADIAISRAGAGSIFEIAACGKPSILIPLALAAQDHQIKNAYAYAQSKACLVMEEANLTPHFFLAKLKYLFSHQEDLEKMANGAKSFAKPESARLLAEYIINYLTK